MTAKKSQINIDAVNHRKSTHIYKKQTAKGMVIKMIAYKPEKNNALPIALCIACMACGITLFALGNFGIGWRLGQQVAAVVLLVVAIEVTTKYILTDYVYEISTEHGTPDLIVTKIGGNRSMAVCNIGADSVVCIEKRGKLREFEEQHGRMDVRYNYISNLRAENVIWVHFIHNEKKALVAIEASDEFLAHLLRYFPS